MVEAQVTRRQRPHSEAAAASIASPLCRAAGRPRERPFRLVERTAASASRAHSRTIRRAEGTDHRSLRGAPGRVRLERRLDGHPHKATIMQPGSEQ